MAAVVIGVGLLAVIAIRKRRRINRLKMKRPEWTAEFFWKEVSEPAFPEAYRGAFLRMLQERAGDNFPVLPADSLAFYDIGTYLSAIEDEFVLDFCEQVRIQPPTESEINELPLERDRIRTVRDLVKALGIWFTMRR